MKKLGLYIHIPFCASKCLYCDFPTLPYQEKRFDEYFKYLFKEIELFSEKLTFYELDSIYLGGGTPNYVPSKKIIELDGIIKSKFNISQDLEYTIEGNPDFINGQNSSDYLSCGINRISIGVQTFEDSLLSKIGRTHKGEDAFQNILLLKEHGFSNINLDFIVGLPNQSYSDILNDLKLIEKLDVPHISYYDLIIEENTRFHYEYIKNNLTLPTEEENRAIYHNIIDELKKFGLSQYEISNFSKKGFQSRHNLKYWENKEYLAFGLGAAGYLNNIRYKNTSDYKKYITTVKDGNLPRVSIERLTLEDKIFEKIIMNMRLVEGVSRKELLEEFNYDIFEKNKTTIEEYERLGLIRLKDDTISFTKLGFDISNKFFTDLLI